MLTFSLSGEIWAAVGDAVDGALTSDADELGASNSRPAVRDRIAARVVSESSASYTEHRPVVLVTDLPLLVTDDVAMLALAERARGGSLPSVSDINNVADHGSNAVRIEVGPKRDADPEAVSQAVIAAIAEIYAEVRDLMGRLRARIASTNEGSDVYTSIGLTRMEWHYVIYVLEPQIDLLRTSGRDAVAGRVDAALDVMARGVFPIHERPVF